jgi:hypothetical protein
MKAFFSLNKSSVSSFRLTFRTKPKEGTTWPQVHTHAIALDSLYHSRELYLLRCHRESSSY